MLLTAVSKFILVDYLNYRLLFTTTACVSWLIYIGWKWKTNRGLFKQWGFRTDNFREVVKMVFPFALIGLFSMIIIGAVQRTLNLTWHILPILISYPIWGLIQQYLLIALVVGNLKKIKASKAGNLIIILIAAVLFAAVHYPLWWLIAATFLLAIFYGWIYLKKQNLFVLGLFHGWLGAIFYYTVMDSDPFLETIGKLIY